MFFGKPIVATFVLLSLVAGAGNNKHLRRHKIMNRLERELLSLSNDNDNDDDDDDDYTSQEPEWIPPVESFGYDTDFHPMLLCDLWQVFHSVTSSYKAITKNDERNRSSWCHPFASLNQYLCPTQQHRDEICNHIKPQGWDNSTRNHFCRPIVESCGEECIRNCVDYVSHARGNCCHLQCD